MNFNFRKYNVNDNEAGKKDQYFSGISASAVLAISISTSPFWNRKSSTNQKCSSLCIDIEMTGDIRWFTVTWCWIISPDNDMTPPVGATLACNSTYLTVCVWCELVCGFCVFAVVMNWHDLCVVMNEAMPHTLWMLLITHPKQGWFWASDSHQPSLLAVLTLTPNCTRNLTILVWPAHTELWRAVIPSSLGRLGSST